MRQVRKFLLPFAVSLLSVARAHVALGQAPATSGTPNCSGYVNPGDGTGITVAQANAANAARAAAIQRGACSGATTSPATPTSSAIPFTHPAPNLGPPTNALQYLLNNLFSRPVPSAGAEAQPAYQPITAPKLLDADAFKAAGCDSITDTMDQLINDSDSGSGGNAPAMENPVDNVSWKQLAKELTQSSTEYVQDAQDAWERLKGNNTTDPLYRTVDALDMAATASGGQVPSTLKAVDTIAAFGGNEEAVLVALAKGGVNDWLYKSGINEYDSGTVPPARAYLDNWSQGLAALQNSIQHFLPLAQGVEGILANDNVTKARYAVEEWTPVGLDAQALEDAINTLKRCSSLIDQIQVQLRTARCDT
jgi:hypothetical protein